MTKEKKGKKRRQRSKEPEGLISTYILFAVVPGNFFFLFFLGGKDPTLGLLLRAL